MLPKEYINGNLYSYFSCNLIRFIVLFDDDYDIVVFGLYNLQCMMKQDENT
jgi:hypothetical protein